MRQEHGFWDTINGIASSTESILEAADRIVREKTGLVAHPLLHLITINGDTAVVGGRAQVRAAVKTTIEETPITYPARSNWRLEPVVKELRWIIPFTEHVAGGPIATVTL